MDTARATISLDDAFDCYEMSKRTSSESPLYYYSPQTNEFRKIRDKSTVPGILFVNAFQLCCTTIDRYLNQTHMAEYKQQWDASEKRYRNKVINFLWFFEHIDGCCNYNEFEVKQVETVLKDWCKQNGLSFTEPEVYRRDGML